MLCAELSNLIFVHYNAVSIGLKFNLPNSLAKYHINNLLISLTYHFESALYVNGKWILRGVIQSAMIVEI